MKYIPTSLIFAVFLAGCTTPVGGSVAGGSRNDAAGVVSGRVVHRNSGVPYERAYVRFEWLVSATEGREVHTYTGADGRYSIQLPAGQYQVSAGDECDLNAGFTLVGRGRNDYMVTVPGDDQVDFVESPITPGEYIPGVC
jgi:Carboxypeptidase regulatory-like domain